MRLRTGLRLPAPEEARQESASARGSAGKLVLQFRDPSLGSIERLLLHDDGLSHEVGGSRLGSYPLSDEGFGLSIPWAALALNLAELGEEGFNSLTILVIHRCQSFQAIGTILPAVP
jgi:hypothetical protein